MCPDSILKCFIFSTLAFCIFSAEALDLLKEESSHPSNMAVETTFVKERFSSRNI
jgi:hypothetical protein